MKFFATFCYSSTYCCCRKSELPSLTAPISHVSSLFSIGFVLLQVAGFDTFDETVGELCTAVVSAGPSARVDQNNLSHTRRVRPVLMQWETWIETAGFRSETKKGVHMQLKTRLFNPTCFDFLFNWIRQSRKLRFWIQHATRIHASVKLESPAAYIRILHTRATATRHTTRPHTTTSATLAWLLSLLLLLAASQCDTSLSTPVSSTCQHPMAAVRGIDCLLPTAALAVALAALEEV